MALFHLSSLHGKPEIFHSLQGEGTQMGRPAVFIRLAHCNLSCHWCDSAYTWQKKEDYLPFFPLEVEVLAQKLKAYPTQHLVITGGEPLLQQKALVELLTLLPEHSCEIETNGTLIPLPFLAERVEQFNVSPKLLHSQNERAKAFVPEALQSLAALPQSWFKFVIASPQDVEEVLFWQKELHLASPKILLMPEGRSSALLREKALWLAPLCLKHNFRLCDRLHIHLWGDKKGC